VKQLIVVSKRKLLLHWSDSDKWLRCEREPQGAGSRRLP
jgi:hypothetical protein